ncbi:MAG TPA: ATP/GTP-binding protein, partial [Porphyromonadaceae bacterium]|nr:ATP/GTP-binding protein [Porphyromonadaceae bacterium]
IKLDKNDINKSSLADNDKDIIITGIFTELPSSIIIDTTNATSFSDEYLLNTNSELEIIKKYPNAGAAKIFIKALHPTNENCSNLLTLKQTDYKKIITEHNIECENMTINAIMRKAIWKHYEEDLRLELVEIDASKDDAKNIWEKIQILLPIYSLFQSDRKNSDSDSEVQDPLKEAVKQILKDDEIAQKLALVAQKVSEKLRDVSDKTLEKLNEMNPDIASSLNPIIPASDSLSWTTVFNKVSISGDDDIPINKRGSGIKRLILLNFFRAEAERRRSSSQPIIYAFEEPETSQHTEHQKLLINAFKDLSNKQGVQVMLTTHSATVVKGLSFDNLRLISKDYEGTKSINTVEPNQLPYPSLNEINFIAFRHLTEEYHNELYGFIEAEGLLTDYKTNKDKIPYNKVQRNGSISTTEIILTEYIRHQIHHPENENNRRYSFEELEQSVNLMRQFILENRSE